MSGVPPPTPPSRRTLHQGRKFSFELLTLPDAAGRPVTREIVRHPGAAVILPVLRTPGGSPRIVLVRNERAAIGSDLVELPAGTLEPPEPPLACAARELEEETGFRAATLAPLGRFYTAPGFSDELMWAFAATGLVRVGQRLEPDERLTVLDVAPDECLAMIDRGDLADGKSIAAIMLAMRHGHWPA